MYNAILDKKYICYTEKTYYTKMCWACTQTFLDNHCCMSFTQKFQKILLNSITDT